MNQEEGYKRPESVLVVVYTQAHEFLMLKRCGPGELWQSITGSLEWGEQAADAAVRELHEETGIQSSQLVDMQRQFRFTIRPEWRARYAENVTENLEHVFTLQLDQAIDIRLNPGEHERYCWVDATQAQQMAFSWTNRDVIQQLSSEFTRS